MRIPNSIQGQRNDMLTPENILCIARTGNRSNFASVLVCVCDKEIGRRKGEQGTMSQSPHKLQTNSKSLSVSPSVSPLFPLTQLEEAVRLLNWNPDHGAAATLHSHCTAARGADCSSKIASQGRSRSRSAARRSD